MKINVIGKRTGATRSDCDCIQQRASVILAPPQVSFDGTVPFTPGFGQAVPQASGVYVINDLRGPLYLGRTSMLRRRYDEHFWDSHNYMLSEALAHPIGTTTFAWIELPPETQGATERYLVRALRPLCNVVQFHVRRPDYPNAHS